MTSAPLHLVITRLPVFGSILCTLVMGYGLWSKTNSTKIAAYCLFIVSGIATGISYLSGERAEEAGKNSMRIRKHYQSA